MFPAEPNARYFMQREPTCFVLELDNDRLCFEARVNRLAEAGRCRSALRKLAIALGTAMRLSRNKTA